MDNEWWANGSSGDDVEQRENVSWWSDHHTLLRLIKQHVNPGTVILTDKSRVYNALGRHGFTHLVVNHRVGVVNPITGVHTNACEGM